MSEELLPPSRPGFKLALTHVLAKQDPVSGERFDVVEHMYLPVMTPEEEKARAEAYEALGQAAVVNALDPESSPDSDSAEGRR